MKQTAFVLFALTLSACSSPAHVADVSPSPQIMPAEFEHGRVFVLPVTTSGETLRFFTDTGGSPVSQINVSTVERLGLQSESVTFGERSVDLVASWPGPSNLPLYADERPNGHARMNVPRLRRMPETPSRISRVSGKRWTAQLDQLSSQPSIDCRPLPYPP